MKQKGLFIGFCLAAVALLSLIGITGNLRMLPAVWVILMVVGYLFFSRLKRVPAVIRDHTKGYRKNRFVGWIFIACSALYAIGNRRNLKWLDFLLVGISTTFGILFLSVANRLKTVDGPPKKGGPDAGAVRSPTE